MEKYDSALWAKSDPFCPLYKHMIAVGACAQTYLRANSSACIRKKICQWTNTREQEMIALLSYAFSLHDVGKAHAAFQFRKEGVQEMLAREGYEDPKGGRKDSFRHEEYGAKALKAIWKGYALDEKIKSILLSAIRMHHQGKGPSEPVRGQDSLWNEIQKSLERRMAALFAPGVPDAQVRHADALGVMLAALLVLCDWVASSSVFGVCPYDEDRACLEWSLHRAEHTLKSFGLISQEDFAFPQETDFTAFWPDISRQGMRPLQHMCEKIGDQPAPLTIIEAPPGEGKTEAALYLAGCLCRQTGQRGVYMAMPTAATSNQMVQRISRMLEQHGIGRARLLHGSAWLVDDISPDPRDMALEEEAWQAAQWLRPLRRGMLAENAVGTVDQAMASVLLIKYGMLRLAGLAGKVLIIDEIHAYDAYMSRIIQRLIQWCRALKIPVILLSATMQWEQKKKYLGCYARMEDEPVQMAYPLITRVDDKGEVAYYPVEGTHIHTRYRFTAIGKLGNIPAIVDLAQEKTKNGGCLCLMLNTVSRAQQVYDELKGRGDKEIMIFHARFPMGRRIAIEKECLRLFGRGGQRPARMILVCTQVVEQSLDVDFDSMITELSPIDLLIQRAGRVFRHEEVTRPEGLKEREILILTPDERSPEDLEKRYAPFSTVYAPLVLHSTEKWLGEGRIVHIPEDVREGIEQVYSVVDENQIEAYIKMLAERDCAQVNADGCTFPAPAENYFFASMNSAYQAINMGDAEDLNALLQRGGARTRDGQESLCVAFLPQDFSTEGKDEKRVRREIAMCSVNLSIKNLKKPLLFEECWNKIEAHPENYKSVFYRNSHCILLWPEADGSYLLAGCRFLADDETGIRKG